MIILCAIWGFQQVAIKAALDDIPALWQSGIRSAVATILLGLWIWIGKKPWIAGLLIPGIIAGALFAAEFALLYTALQYTDSARVTLLMYTSPFVVAAGAHCLIRDDKLSVLGWLGVSLAFVGVAVMMLPSLFDTTTNNTRWLGDLLALAGGIAWGLTTLVVKTTPLATAHPTQTLFYQLWVSGVLLCLLAWLTKGAFSLPTTALSWSSMIFQIVIVALLSYLAWFVLITQYPVTKVSVFSFLTPVLGSFYGVFFLDEVISRYHLFALVLIVLGIILVNRYGHRQPVKQPS